VFGVSNRSDFWISNKKIDFLVKLLVQEFHNCVSCTIYNDRSPRTLGYAPASGQAVTGLQLSPPREARPLTQSVVFHKNSLLL
jgi:hypothetical protein